MLSFRRSSPTVNISDVAYTLRMIDECQAVLLLTCFLLQSAALLNAIKEYENQKWKVIGQKVGKPAKVRVILSF